MATVAKSRNTWLLLSAMLILFSAAFAAGFISTCDACHASDIQLKLQGYNLSATLAIFNTTLDIQHDDLGSLQDSYDSAQLGKTEDSYDLLEQEDLDLDSLFDKVHREVIYPENAEIYFYYFNTTYDTTAAKTVSIKIEIDDCYPALTGPGGVVNCTLPDKVYKDSCNMVYASFCNPDNPYSDICQQAKPSTAQAYICGEKSDSISRLSAILDSNLSTLSSPLCFVSIILGGLLLASMFFSGRSPLSLLDITTPLLPKAKSVSYSGISMGTGITRMGRAADIMVKEIENSSEATFHELTKFYRTSTGFNARLLGMIMDSNASHSMKMIALRALISGRGENDIRKILKIDPNDADQLTKELGSFISAFKSNPNAEMNRQNRLDDRIALLSEQRILIEMQKKAFSLATGQVPKGFMGKVKQTIGNLPVVGDHFRGFTASAFFGAKQVRTVYSSFGKGVARTAIGRDGMDRIQMSVDAEKARTGKSVGGFRGWVALSDDEKNLVTLFNIYERGNSQYKGKIQEAKNDVLNWLVRKTLEHYGASLNLNEDQVMQIGFKGPNELMFAALRAGAFGRIEKELRAILSSNRTEYDKAERIMQLMLREGIDFDRAGALAAVAMLRKIETEVPLSYRDAIGADRYANQEAVLNSHRLIRLQKYLEEQFKVSQGIDADAFFRNKFYFTVGRPDLKYVYYEGGSMRVIDQTFSTYFLSEYRKQLEGAKPNQKNPVSFADVANYCFLRIVNERWGLMDPNTPGLSAEVKIVMQKAREWLLSLSNPGMFSGTASMNDLVGKLYAPDARYEKDTIAVGGHGKEHGPSAGIWRMDMSAHWRALGRDGVMGGARTSVENQSFKEVYYSHTVPGGVYDIMRRQMDAGAPITQERAMEIYLKQVTARNLFERMKNIIEQDSPNAYFSSQREFDYFHGILGAYREYLARKQGKKEFEISDREIEKFIQKPIGLKELGDDSWIRLREGSWVPFSQKNSFKLAQADRVVNAMAYIKQDGVWKEFIPEKLLTDGLFRKRMRPLEEFGDITPAGNEVLKSYHALLGSLKKQTERVEGFDVSKSALLRADVREFIRVVAEANAREGKDSRKGMAYTALLLRLSFEDPRIKDALDKMGISIENDPRLAGSGFGDSIKGGALAQKYLGARNEAERERAVSDLKEWARQGSPQDNRQMRVAILFHNYGMRANDMRDFNSYDDGIRIAPMGMKSFTTETGAVEQVGGVRNWLRQAFRPLHMELEQFTLSAFAKQTRSEYESSLVSEYYRETGAKFAGKLLAGEFGRVDDMNSPAMRAYNSLADSFGRYHAIWDETITRDPRGNSSAIGHSFIFSSFFHHGPGMPFGPAFYKRWITPGMNSTWYSKDRLTEGFKYMQMTPQMFNWMLAGPFIGAYRTFLTSKFGYPSKYDRNYISRTTEQANIQYGQTLGAYNSQLDQVAKQMKASELAAGRPDELRLDQEVRRRAEQELRNQGIMPPEKPAVSLERNILDPFSMSTPRDRDGWRALSNWFYASFDPTSMNLKRNISRLISPVTAFIPSTKIHGAVIGQEWHFADSFYNPYYVSPEGARGQLLKMTGPMIKRQYGGTEILTGVVRAPEDMWAFQAGVNVIWGNANPGVSYVDFNNSLQMDQRAASYLRYESRFKPYFTHDQYVEKQANLGMVRREIDPTMMMLDRNKELRGYRAPDNRLYQFLNPATFALYRATSWAARGKRFVNDVHDFAEGLATYDGSNRGVGVYAGYAAGRASQFLENRLTKQKIKFTTELRYCSCGSPMPADGACPACSQKMRCEHCHSMVSAHQTHICQHGLRRNILMDEMQENGVLGGMDVWKNSSRRWGRGV